MTKKGKIKRGKKIKNYLWMFRKKMGSPSKEMAYLMGHKTSSLISCWENGRKLPSLNNAFKLSIILRTPVEFLFEDHYLELRKDIRAKEEEIKGIDSSNE